MKTARRTEKDEMRAEYERSDFPKGFLRGKYGERLRESSNIVMLKPEVAEAFPNQEAVNNALLLLIRIAEKSVNITSRSTGRAKRRRTS